MSFVALARTGFWRVGEIIDSNMDPREGGVVNPEGHERNEGRQCQSVCLEGKSIES